MRLLPPTIDRLIVHQVDLARPSPGGIDTCLRGIAKYAPAEVTLAFIGVDTGAGPSSRRLGVWESYEYGSRTVWFLPVAKVDPGDQRRLVPHSLKLILGLLRFLKRIPSSRVVQAHRMDTALLSTLLVRKPLVYMVHTQRGGLTGKTSDSFWRFARPVHELLEKRAVKLAADVVVFNENYSETVRSWNPVARFSPTWWDPELITTSFERVPGTICWVGRLETPKDPELALKAIEQLHLWAPGQNWRLVVLGSGTLMGALRAQLSGMPPHVQQCVQLLGRVDPQDVARVMGSSQLFLMTSHPGYEGYPRVLVEALASGLPAVVTEGSDTGNIVKDNVNGFVTDRDPSNIAEAIIQATKLHPASASGSVKKLSAPVVVGGVLSGGRAN